MYRHTYIYIYIYIYIYLFGEQLLLQDRTAKARVEGSITSEHKNVALYQMKADTKIDGAWDDTMASSVVYVPGPTPGYY